MISPNGDTYAGTETYIMLDICLLGTSGMMPLPSRWLSSLMARYNGSSILIDCGEGTQIAIKEKGWSVHDIDVICITHFHADHISGLPGLLLSMGNAERGKPLLLIGPSGLTYIVNSLRVIAPELPFSLKFMEISDDAFEMFINGYHIEAFKLNHNIPCYGYTIKVRRAGRFMPEKAAANDVPMAVWSRLQKNDEAVHDGVRYTNDMILGPERRGLKVTYCTDTRPTKSIILSAQNADLFICEGMYGEMDEDAKAARYKHMTFAEAATLARKAKVKELWLTHYSPSLVRPEEYIKKTREIFPNTIAARDRRTKVLEFDKDET